MSAGTPAVTLQTTILKIFKKNKLKGRRKGKKRKERNWQTRNNETKKRMDGKIGDKIPGNFFKKMRALLKLRSLNFIQHVHKN
jgi:hypothetical protein